MRLGTLIRGWDQFFFRAQSPLPVAVFRIAFGILLLACLVIQLWPDFDFWYGQYAVFSFENVRAFYFQNRPVLNVFDALGNNPALCHAYFDSLVVAAVFLTIGFGTRYSAFYSYLGLISLHAQAPLNLNGGDNFMRLACLFLAFSYAGETLSVDRWIKEKFFHQNLKDRKYWPWAQRMIQLQLALVYWQASVAKCGGEQWINGTATYYSSRLEDFFNFHIPWIFDGMAACTAFSWATLIVEVALWTLVWIREFRYWVLGAGVLLHLGIDLTMSLPLFEWLFVACYVLFIDPDDLVKLGNWVLRLPEKLGHERRVAVASAQTANESSLADKERLLRRLNETIDESNTTPTERH